MAPRKKMPKATSTILLTNKRLELSYQNIVEQIKNMSKTDKIMIFIEDLYLTIQVEVNYHMFNKLEETIKMAINYDNAHFHSKLLASKTNVKMSSKKKCIVYIFLCSEIL